MMTRKGTDVNKIADLDLPPPRQQVLGQPRNQVNYADIDLKRTANNQHAKS